MTDNQQSVNMNSEDTDSQDNTDTDHTYDHSSYQEAIINILCPDLNSESDSDKDDRVTVQAKSKCSIVLRETAKIDHIWAKWKGARYFSSLNIRSGCHHISIHPESRPKTAFICPCGKFQ